MINFFVFLTGGAMAIINGKQADQAYPWLATIFVDGKELCGASLIKPNVLLTAAHCLFDQKMVNNSVENHLHSPQDYTIYIGKYNLSNPLEGYEYKAVNLLAHPTYGKVWPQFDVGLIQLAPNPNNSLTQFITLDDGTFSKPNTNLTVIGFGMINEDGGHPIKPTILMQTTNTVLDNTTCLSESPSYKKRPDNAFNIPQETELCVKNMEKDGINHSYCGGDSGGPLFVKLNDQYVLVTIASRSQGCGQFDDPSYGPNISKLRDWIQSSFE